MAALVVWSVLACAHIVKKQRNKRIYKYHNSHVGPRETRRLTLAPGSFFEDLKGDVQIISIDDPQRVPYEAVSYVWGPTSSRPDFIKLGSSSRRLWLPPNLAQALRYLRKKDAARTLWIDFISVRQDDHAEKAAQVALMTEIYRAAERVVVWLGHEANDSNIAIGLLDELAWMVEFDFENTRMRPTGAGAIEPTWADPTEYLPYEQDELWAIYQLVHRAWFGRVWIRQEIAAADPQTAIVVCGNKSISWEMLRTALAVIANKPRHFLDLNDESSPELRFARRYEMVLLLCQPEKDYTLPDLLDQGRKFSCSDPRDRVYAVMNLASDVDNMGLIPNYDLTTSQVYQDTVLRYIQQSKNTNILASCEIIAARKTMPTWVPDWSRKRIANTMPMHLASSMSEAHAGPTGNGVLKASGAYCATVAEVTELFGDFVPVLQVIATVRQIAPADVLSGPYMDRAGGLLEAYCATLAWGLFDSLYNPPMESYPDHDVSIESLKLVLEQQEDSKRTSSSYDYSTLVYVTQLIATCKGRSFFTTQEGYIGLGPKYTKPGDKVYVVLGCDVPLILRDRHSGGDRANLPGEPEFEVVGDSYVHGLMSGEALLGPLPNECQMVMDSDDPDEPTRPMFIMGLGNGAFKTAHDPRLEKVRAAATSAACEKTQGGSVEELLTPENLRAAGANVVDLHLV
ncbi:hypothetical protein D7B24_002947 [Verticillium nonalfalfae]|uniref:Heterokaryon incompatibility domain-containing protein n=1 Tax=Verticillium nonalfalfae TaxID=1051616 RepID=A0A3M9XY67_9PEZI|nr:uncharacterized protein D7B24_002947 [Verticillium nonalfalfae]RNJ52732.1 hypothetical protein D7B24_002947 [Verticillium nonalfalfae]